MSVKLRPHLSSHPAALSMVVIEHHAYLNLVLDTEDGPVEVDPMMLEQMGLSREQAFADAVEWLWFSSSEEHVLAVDTVPGMFYVRPEGGQVASRLMVLPGLMDEAPLGGVLAAVPCSNQLLCVPLTSTEMVQAMRVLAGAVGAAYEHATHPISDQLFWYDGQGWHVVHVERASKEITVLPPDAFFQRMRQVASMDLVRVAGEA